MSVKVMSWVWEHSQSKGMDRLVLLAVADCAADDGANAFPSMAKLMAKTGLTDRGIQKCMLRLVESGELVVFRNAGPRGCNRYRVRMRTPEPSSPPPNDVHPEPGSPPTSEPGSPRTTFTPNHVHHPPEPGSPGTVLEPSEISTAATQQPALSVTQRSKRITDAYAVAEPMCKWPAVNGIVMKAIKSQRFTDEEIRDALLRLAAEGRGVTIETLRVELQGLPPPGNGRRQSTTDQRMAQGAALAARLEAGQPLEIDR